MTLEIEVKFNRVGDVRVNNSAGRTIARAIALALFGEKANMMPLANDDDCDLWINLELFASSCRSRKQESFSSNLILNT
jgi:hypothetical protein